MRRIGRGRILFLFRSTRHARGAHREGSFGRRGSAADGGRLYAILYSTECWRPAAHPLRAQSGRAHGQARSLSLSRPLLLLGNFAGSSRLLYSLRMSCRCPRWRVSNAYRFLCRETAPAAPSRRGGTSACFGSSYGDMNSLLPRNFAAVSGG